MNDELKCPVCGELQKNTRSLALHMWNHHKIKYKEYMEGKQPINESKYAEGLLKPTTMKESKEFVNETPAATIDKDIIIEAEKPDREFVTKVHNPYRDLYPADGQVMNEWLR